MERSEKEENALFPVNISGLNVLFNRDTGFIR